MNRKQSLVTIVAALLIICLGLPSFSWAAYDQKEVLRGLKGVKVVVEAINPDVQRFGLDANQIKTNVENQVRRAGIKVLKSYQPPAMTALYINVSTLIPYQARTIVVYNINVMVYENVYLKRGIGTVGDLKEVRAADWVKASVGLLGVNHVNDIYKKLELQVDKFISDYLAMNQ
jgi:hypothetical protein